MEGLCVFAYHLAWAAVGAVGIYLMVCWPSWEEFVTAVQVIAAISAALFGLAAAFFCLVAMWHHCLKGLLEPIIGG